MGNLPSFRTAGCKGEKRDIVDWETASSLSFSLTWWHLQSDIPNIIFTSTQISPTVKKKRSIRKRLPFDQRTLVLEGLGIFQVTRSQFRLVMFRTLFPPSNKTSGLSVYGQTLTKLLDRAGLWCIPFKLRKTEIRDPWLLHCPLVQSRLVKLYGEKDPSVVNDCLRF